VRDFGREVRVLRAGCTAMRDVGRVVQVVGRVVLVVGVVISMYSAGIARFVRFVSTCSDMYKAEV